MTITFKPLISPSPSPSPLHVEENQLEQINKLIEWLFSVQSNARSQTSENITVLEGLAEKLPSLDAIAQFPILVTKVTAVFESIKPLQDLYAKANDAIGALKAAFPQARQVETPVSVSKPPRDLCFSPCFQRKTPS